MAEKILFKTLSEWSFDNTVLLRGQLGVESDTQSYKVGDGITKWNELKYNSYNGTILYINTLYI